jgi:hypothetical protein
MNTKAVPRRLAVVALAAASLVATALVPPAGAQEDSWVREQLDVSTQTLLAGGFYAWTARVDQPTPAEMFGAPEGLVEAAGAQPMVVTWHWGDGSPNTVIDTTQDPSLNNEGGFWCDADYQVDEGTDPPTYYPGENYGYDCGFGVGHTYNAQGLYTLYLTAEQYQPGEGQVVTSRSADYPQLVTDLAKGGSLTGKGTVYAPAGGGGMYDQDFQGGPLTFSVTAKRKSGTAATSVLVKISVPSMNPDYPPADPPTGLEFTGRAGLAPLWVTKTRTGGEAFSWRVEGTVTNSAGSAGTAWATIHAKVQKGQTTLVRVQLQNSSAGYTYVDTNPSEGYYELGSTDVLTSGSLKIG